MLVFSLSSSEFFELQIVDIEHPLESIAKQKRVLAVIETPRHFVQVSRLASGVTDCPFLLDSSRS